MRFCPAVVAAGLLFLAASPASGQPSEFGGGPAYRFTIKNVPWWVTYGESSNHEVGVKFQNISIDRKKKCVGVLEVTSVNVDFKEAPAGCGFASATAGISGVRRDATGIVMSIGVRTVTLEPAAGPARSAVYMDVKAVAGSPIAPLIERSLAHFADGEAEFFRLIGSDKSLVKAAAPLLRKRGFDSLGRNQPAEAAVAFERALAADSDWSSQPANNKQLSTMLWHVARAKLKASDEAGARTLFDRYLQTDSRYAPLQPTLGLLLLQDGRAAARDEEERAASAAAQQRDWNTALRRYTTAYALTVPASGETEQNQRLLTALARVYKSMSPRPELPEEARRHFIQGEALAKSERYEEAQQSFARASQIAPWYPGAMFNRALVLGSLKRYSEAMDVMRQFIAVTPDAAAARGAQDKIYEWEVASPNDARRPDEAAGSAPRESAMSAGTPTAVTRPSTEPAIVHFYRDGGASYIQVFCDNILMGELRGKRYLAVRLAPGAHQCYVDAAMAKPSQPMAIAPGLESYFSVDTAFPAVVLIPVTKAEWQATLIKLRPAEPKSLKDGRAFIPRPAKAKP